MIYTDLQKLLKIKFIEAGGVTEAQAAAWIGKTQPPFNKRLREGGLKYWEIEEIADHLGYKITWVKKYD